MPGIGIVTNPNSRRNRRFPQSVRRLAYVLGDDADHIQTQTPEEIYQVAEKFKSKGIDILALNGGDGTNHFTLTAFIHVYGDHPLPKIVFLRGGTMNTISNAVGIQGRPATILLNIAEKYHLNLDFGITKRRILKISFDDQVHYGFIFGNGLTYGFLKAYYATGHPSPWSAITTFSKAFVDALLKRESQVFMPFQGKIIWDGQPSSHDIHAAVLASTIEQVGLGFRPMFRCRESLEHFDVLDIFGSATDIARHIYRARTGQPLPESFADHRLAQHIRFQSSQPHGFFIDGDMHEAHGDLEISLGPILDIIQS